MQLSSRTVIVLAAVVGMVACSAPETNEPAPARGRITVQIHDRPSVGVQEVWLTVDEVTARAEGGFVTISDQPATFDLLALQGGVVEVLGSADAPAGLYDQIRFEVTDSWVIDRDGNRQPLHVPSGRASGLKVKTEFEVTGCEQVLVDIDWDIEKNLHFAPGKGHILKPVFEADTTLDDSTCHACQGEVTFAEPEVEAAVRAELALPTGPLDATEVEQLTELNINNRGVSDISGLECATNLRLLRANGNQITDIAPLGGLTSLEDVRLNANDVSDLSPLAGATELRILVLNRNSVSDISALANKPELQIVQLEGNNVSDISALATSPKLEQLWLTSNNVADISALSNAPRLQDLRMTENQVSDLSPLAGASDLRFLSLNSNSVSDIGALASKPELRFVQLATNSITDILPLSTSPLLEQLWVSVNPISDISVVAGLANLNDFRMRATNVSDLTPLSGKCGLSTAILLFSPYTCPNAVIDGLLACGVNVISDCP